MFKSLLVPVDLADPSSWKQALPTAVELARAGNGAVTVITVIRELHLLFEAVEVPFQIERVVAEAEQALGKIVTEPSLGMSGIQIEVCIGSIANEIVAAARRRNADLIVMASHRPQMRDYLIGPNAAHVVRHAPCSVLVLRPAGAGAQT